jgi:hypothetical protein
MAKSGSRTGISGMSARWTALSGMRKSGNRFSARIPLLSFGIDPVHDFGWILSQIMNGI